MSRRPYEPADGNGGSVSPDRDTHDPLDHFGPSGRWLRGALVVLGAVVVGALLMPSATRAPIGVSAAAQTTTTTTTANAGQTSPSSSVPPTTTASTATTAAPTVVPGASAIHVLVANGTSITGLAGGVAAYLRSRGFSILSAVNSTTRVTGTQVYAAAGQQGAANTVVGALGLPNSVVQPSSAVAPVASTQGATAVVVAGPDLSRYAPGGSTSSGGTAASTGH